MSFYTNKQPADARKLRGGFYTPSGLADYLTRWGVRDDTRRILEPSCGDGNFIVSLLNQLNAHPTLPEHPPQIVAVELVGSEIERAQTRANELGHARAEIEWVNKDFFEAYTELAQTNKFDLVIGNPPFIRFQHFNDDSRERAFDHLRAIGYKPSKLDNVWVAFVQLSIELLRPRGRLAMVVPGELLQVKYASQLRHQLSVKFDHVILVGFRKLVFPEIQQEIFLLLADGKKKAATSQSNIHTLEFDDGEELLAVNSLTDAVAHLPAKHSRNGMKWTALFLDERSFSALDDAEKAKGLKKLGDLASVDIGIVTGRNSFFILTTELKDKLQANNLTIPIIGRTSALKSTSFNSEDFSQYSTIYPSYLLDLNKIDESSFSERVESYLKSGQKDEVHEGYKCRIRDRWFDVPSIYTPDLFLFRQIHRYPLLVVNKARAASTDTIHRVRLKQGINADLLASTAFNSLTLAWAEVCGRSYGGGVLELEPREAEELPIPYQVVDIDTEKVDTLLRKGHPYEALDYVDRVLLKDRLGFDDVILREVRRAWEQLRDRRMGRKNK